MSIFANIVGTDHLFAQRFERNLTVRELLENYIAKKKWDCSADELSLYFARKNGQRLDESEPEALDLIHGKISDGVRQIMSDENRIDPNTLVRTFHRTCGTYLLLFAPPRIQRLYRKSVAETRRSLIKLGLLAVEDADLESFEELPVCWWKKLTSYVLPLKVVTQKKML